MVHRISKDTTGHITSTWENNMNMLAASIGKLKELGERNVLQITILIMNKIQLISCRVEATLGVEGKGCHGELAGGDLYNVAILGYNLLFLSQGFKTTGSKGA